MKKILAIVILICASFSVSRAEGINSCFDGSAGKSGKAWDIRREVSWDTPVPVLSLVAGSRNRDLTSLERQNILLSLNSSEWTTSSGDNYAFQWMPQKFKLVGGSTLLVEVRTQAAGMTPNILVPVKVNGDKYEFGPWNYSHCSPSMTNAGCFYKIRVQFEIVSDSVLQGTIYAQNAVNPGEPAFVYYKKNAGRNKDLISHGKCINDCIDTWLKCTATDCQKKYDCCTNACDGVVDPTCK